MKQTPGSTRRCPLCDHQQSELLYTQNFANYFRHVIVCCRNCGFVFVKNTPGQVFYNNYYRDMSKYEEDRDYKLHEVTCSILKQRYSLTAKILDVGCSTGHLLHLLQKQGFKNLQGVDPAPKAREAALEQFGLPVTTASINTFKPKEKYDLIILSAVLEHLSDISGSLKKIGSWLAEDGSIFISVPDAEHFYKNFEEPFGEFSTEHINFFSQASLYRALPNYNCIYTYSDGGALYSIWQKGGELKRSIKTYIDLSSEKSAIINRVIGNLPDEVIVWGAGSLTQRLLTSTSLASKVMKFVDRNRVLQGTTLAGVDIIGPDAVKYYTQPIFICSFRFKDEIVKEIKQMKLKNKVIHF